MVEFWATSPGDGWAYFVIRPPWVRPDRITTYYTLYPEVRRLCGDGMRSRCKGSLQEGDKGWLRTLCRHSCALLCLQEADWRTSTAVVDMQRTRPLTKLQQQVRVRVEVHLQEGV